MGKLRLTIAVLILVILLLGRNAGRWLVLDEPQQSNVILVLAGEARYRPARGLELLSAGYGSKLVLDVPAGQQIFQTTIPELAGQWAKSLPQAAVISICPIYGLSTSDEAREAAHCLQPTGAHSVLLVTSDFHTRRALSTFRHEMRGTTFSVAAAHDPRQFGVRWWTRREWAKTALYEWMRVLWWDLIDRWR